MRVAIAAMTLAMALSGFSVVPRRAVRKMIQTRGLLGSRGRSGESWGRVGGGWAGWVE
jgi:hypothetical protein